MRVDDFRIGTRLILGFILVILVALAAVGMGLKQIGMIGDLIGKMYNHPLTVGYTVRDIQTEIDQMNARMQRLALVGEDSERESVKHWIDDAAVRVQLKFDLVKKRFLGDMDNVEIAHRAFEDWKQQIDNKFAQMESTKDRAPLDQNIYVNKIEQMDDLQKKLQVMIDYAAGKAQSFLETAQQQEARARIFMTAMMGAMFFFSLMVAFLITRSIAPPLGIIVQRMRDIAEGDLGHDDLTFRQKDEIGALAESFRIMQHSLRNKAAVADAIAAGDFNKTIEVKGDKDTLGNALVTMTRSLRESEEEGRRQDWTKTGKNELGRIIVGQADLHAMVAEVIRFLAEYIPAQIGALYIADDTGRLNLTASYAFSKRKSLAACIEPGEGIVGQAAIERQMISITDIPPDYIRINSALGDSPPRNIVAIPLLYENGIKGVVELGSFETFSDEKLNLLGEVAQDIAIAIHTVQNHGRVKELLEQTQRQTDQLRVQEEELRVANEELEQQTQSLKRSEEALKQQQEELRVTNEELEEKNSHLERQKVVMHDKNKHLEDLRLELEKRANQLEVTSKYKSEFLANMSHELRTPLNSLLILSRDLENNTRGNLDPEQVECARVIHKSGTDLLTLINEILDLSKIEAGRLSLQIGPISLAEVKDHLKQYFDHIALEKAVGFTVTLSDDLPERLTTDSQRLEQILNNLVSNALKFTEQGEVKVRIQRPSRGTHLTKKGLTPETSVAFSVSDTGIGIPEEKQLQVFEAFQQADSGTSRKFGGTGLGLSIARELTRLLGGEIRLESTVGEGSTFTLYLPESYAALAGQADVPEKTDGAVKPAHAATEPGAVPAVPTVQKQIHQIPDDRHQLTDGDRVILIVEDDAAFAKILLDQCHRNGFKALVSATGENGLTLAQAHLPTAILLDIKLPGMNGWTVLNALKSDPATRHIPVHIVSVEETSLEALQRGAIGFMTKPATRQDLEAVFERVEQVVEKKIKDLLVVEDNAELRHAIVTLINDSDVCITEVNTASETLAVLKKTRFDCMILDLGLPDMSGFELLKRIEAAGDITMPPVIVYTGKDLTHEEELELRGHAESIIIKGARSEERLLDEVALFLHKTVSAMPVSQRQMIISLHNRDALFTGKTILLVDDDMRNLFALSKVLMEKGLTVLKAEDGKKALSLLEAHPAIELVLLDIMMPVMDGYQTARAIRADSRFRNLPIIALTAKALKEDRNQCIAAGANDYLAKPLEMERLLSMMRVWLYRQGD